MNVLPHKIGKLVGILQKTKLLFIGPFSIKKRRKVKELEFPPDLIHSHWRALYMIFKTDFPKTDTQFPVRFKTIIPIFDKTTFRFPYLQPQVYIMGYKMFVPDRVLALGLFLASCSRGVSSYRTASGDDLASFGYCHEHRCSEWGRLCLVGHAATR
mgnify:CR=1 FL=1